MGNCRSTKNTNTTTNTKTGTNSQPQTGITDNKPTDTKPIGGENKPTTTNNATATATTTKDPAVDNTGATATDKKVESSTSQIPERSTRTKVEGSYKCLEKKVTKEVTLENTFLGEVNYSARRITKFFKDQRPNHGDEPFKDDFFPPNNNSIFGKGPDGEYVDPNQDRMEEAIADFQYDETDIIWLRPAEIFGTEDYAVFEGKIEFDDVRQGAIGNCYFMASISALTETPQIIAEIFRHHEVQKSGCYEITLKLDGEWQVVVLDDYIPCSKNSRKPLFANPKGNELWAMLLEKAWAKVNGGYALTVAGMASEVIECLTNFPYEYHQIKTTEEELLWSKIIEASGNEFVMTAALPQREGASDVGLVEGHEYTLEEGQEACVNGNIVRLCRIRNPWGSIDYTGDWGKDSDLWTDEAKALFKYSDTYDGEGEFYISYENFRFFFADVDICRISDNICLKQEKLSYEQCKTPNLFEIHVHKQCEVDFTVFKPYYRFNKTLPTDYTISQHMIVARCEDEDNFVFSTFWGHQDSCNDVSMSKTLEPGSYFVYIYINYNSAMDYETPVSQDVLSGCSSMFSCYSSEFVDFHYKGQDKEGSMLYRMISSYAKSNCLAEVENGMQVSLTQNFLGSEIYFYYIKNHTCESMELSFCRSDCGIQMVGDDCNDIKVVIKPEQEYMKIGFVLNIYDKHGLGYDGMSWRETHDDHCSDSLFPCLMEMPECPADHTNISLYKWMYKRGEVNYEHILKKVDISEQGLNYWKSKYPDEVREIMKVGKLPNHDSLKLEVLDKIDMGEPNWYFGESKTVDCCLEMHGRGICFLEGNKFVGQFTSHNFTGTGYVQYPDGSRLSGMFENFEGVGNMKKTMSDGRVVS